MTRPSKNLDQKLIEAGKEVLLKQGFSGLKVRTVAQKAGVNLGMFTYYFGTKEKFLEKIMLEVYGEFFKDFTIESKSGEDCRQQLKNASMTIGRFVRDNRPLVMALFEEVIRGNNRVMEIAKNNMYRHVIIIVQLIRECQKKGFIAKMPIPNVAILLFMPVVGPNFIIRILEKYPFKLPVAFFGEVSLNVLGKLLDTMVMTDKEIERRIDIVLKGLSA